MEDPRKFGIVKLNEENYHIWQQRTELWLKKEDLWDVVELPVPAVPDDAWLKRDRQARGTIGLLIEDRFLTDIKHEPTASSTWSKIKQIHSRNTLGSRLLLYKKIFAVRYSPGSNMVDHITSILEAASKLEDAGYPLLEELVCSAIMGSLPREYDVLITTIEGRSASDISIDYVRQKIIEEHRKKDPRTNNPEHNTRALFTPAKDHANRNKFTRKCYYCHKLGHIRADCRLLKNHEAHGNFTKQTRPKEVQQTKLTSFRPREETGINVSQPNYSCHDTMVVRAMNTHTNKPKPSEDIWIVDTGAADHMTNNLNKLTNIKPVSTKLTVVTASGESQSVTQKGDCTIILNDEHDNKYDIVLKDVLYVPALTDDLLSIPRLDKEGYTISFTQNISWLERDDKKMVLGKLDNKLYVLKQNTAISDEKTYLCGHVWHSRLAHRNQPDLERMIKKNMADGFNLTPCKNSGVCEPCNIAKMSNAPFKSRTEKKATKPFQIIHSDLCGPIHPESLGHNSYILSLTDEYSGFSQIYMLSTKDQTMEKVKEYIETGINQFNRRPEIFFSDCGGEFDNRNINLYLSERGIKHLTSLPYTPQENGREERYNRTLLEATRTLLQQAKLPDMMWAEIANTANYLLNLVGHRELKASPYELWTGQKPSLSHLRTIGTKCHFLNTKPHKKKLDDRGITGILVGYGPSTSFYRILSCSDNKIYQSRRVIFAPEHCPYQDNETKIIHLGNTPDMNDESKESSTTEDLPTTTPRRSQRNNKGKAPLILSYDQLGNASQSPQDWYQSHTQQHQDTNTE